jgi:hypothetical protein
VGESQNKPFQFSFNPLLRIDFQGSRAFLVEAFDRILIAKVRFPKVTEEPQFHRCIAPLVEKEDLLPF